MTDLILRPWQKQDAQALASIANNRNIWNNVRDFFPSPYTVVDALQWIAKTATEKPVLNFAIVWQQQLVGGCGCIKKEDLYRKNIEIGYFIGEPYWGKGIATEACRLLCYYISEQMEMVRIEAHTFQNNKASMRVLQKNNFYLEAIKKKSVFKNNELMDEYLWVKMLR
ncbi:GNAT family N-acetyltransferase [Sediminibacterium sp.]|uniref:GNAT family N-acetyltransferase n=1 Tax=Sediminibacterium sp. TaxID=1917865 RepID=UPI0025EA2551|nr:GNAT family N-acetyltransferase [Sediminibacterium sp.]MBW0176760.1 GNAT family N-acetyltransferase [Sediminibacterium sp.]